MILIPIFIAALFGAIVYLVIIHAPSWSASYYSTHVSQVKHSCAEYGYGCIEKFIEEFNKIQWERDHKFENSLFEVDYYISKSKTKIHASIIEFDGKGMILNRRDFRKAGKIINAKLKEIGSPEDAKNTIDWGCKDKIVLCGYCKKPIHIDDFGGIQKSVGLFHSECYIKANAPTQNETK